MTEHGYARTNRADVDLEEQHRALREAGIAQGLIVSDLVASGHGRADQRQLTALMGSLQAGDTIVVDHLYRLGRSVMNVKQVLSELKALGVTVKATNHSNTSVSALVSCAHGMCRPVARK